ncbi:MBL fold metallo-hydrolase [Dietzia sp. E1]|nr:MBL fold metallo-hydrolase [Dietzia sp. E1]
MAPDSRPSPTPSQDPLRVQPGLSRRSLLSALGGAAAATGITGLTAGPAAAQSVTGSLGAGSLGSSGVTPPGGIPAAEREPLELILLGTLAGPMVEKARVGIASALVVNGAAYIIDCGRSSVTQYGLTGLELSAIRDIFITHLHSDHIADYYNFALIGGVIANAAGDTLSGPVGVWGPGSAGGLRPPNVPDPNLPVVAPHSPTPGTVEMTERLHEAYAYTSNIFIRDNGPAGGPPDPRTLFDVHDIPLPDVGASYLDTAPQMDPFLVMEDENVTVTATLVPHGPVFPSFAFRFDTAHGSVTFSGDTRLSENFDRLARGSDTVVHEAINVRGADLPPAFVEHNLESHVEVQEVGGVAERAGAARLVLTHLGDYSGSIDARQWKAWAQQGYSGEVIVGHDLQRIVLARR